MVHESFSWAGSFPEKGKADGWWLWQPIIPTVPGLTYPSRAVFFFTPPTTALQKKKKKITAPPQLVQLMFCQDQKSSLLFVPHKLQRKWERKTEQFQLYVAGKRVLFGLQARAAHLSTSSKNLDGQGQMKNRARAAELFLENLAKVVSARDYSRNWGGRHCLSHFSHGTVHKKKNWSSFLPIGSMLRGRRKHRTRMRCGTEGYG